MRYHFDAKIFTLGAAPALQSARIFADRDAEISAQRRRGCSPATSGQRDFARQIDFVKSHRRNHHLSCFYDALAIATAMSMPDSAIYPAPGRRAVMTCRASRYCRSDEGFVYARIDFTEFVCALVLVVNNAASYSATPRTMSRR